jgi:hypothetical protein
MPSQKFMGLCTTQNPHVEPEPPLLPHATCHCLVVGMAIDSSCVLPGSKSFNFFKRDFQRRHPRRLDLAKAFHHTYAKHDSEPSEVAPNFMHVLFADLPVGIDLFCSQSVT